MYNNLCCLNPANSCHMDDWLIESLLTETIKWTNDAYNVDELISACLNRNETILCNNVVI